MKLKYYLRGLGIGILVSTILLMISSSIHKPELSDEEIMSRARELGMVMYTEMSADEGIPKAEEDTEEEKETGETEAAKENEQPKETETTKEDKKPKDTEKAEEDKKPKETEKAGKDEQPKETEQPQNPQPEKTVKEFTIKSGESSNTVAENLQKAGLVDDAQKFNEYLVNEKYDSRILPGTVQIPEGASYKEIAELIAVKSQ